MKIRKNDNIIVLKGKDRNKIGHVSLVFSKDKVVVKGINIIIKHQKKNQKNPQGGIIEKYAPINISDIAIICNSCSRPTKIGFMLKGQEKTRICRKCKANLDMTVNTKISTDKKNKL